MNKLIKGGLFLIALVLFIFSVMTLIAGGMTIFGTVIFAALGIGSALVIGSTGWDGGMYLVNYFKFDVKKTANPSMEQKKGNLNIDLSNEVTA